MQHMTSLGWIISWLRWLRSLKDGPWGRVLLYTGVFCLSVSWLVSTGFSKIYPGYLLSPPRLTKEVQSFETIEAAAQLTSQVNGDQTAVKLVIDELPLTPNKGELVEEMPSIDPAVIIELQRLIDGRSLSFLDYGKKSYELSAQNFRGFAVQFINARSQRRIRVTLSSGQVSNQKYAHYTMLFAAGDPGELGPLLEWRRYYSLKPDVPHQPEILQPLAFSERRAERPGASLMNSL